MSICIIYYISICITFRQVQISEVTNATLFCCSSVTTRVASQSLAVITPSHAAGREQLLWNIPEGALWWEAHTWGARPWLLPWATPTSTALRLPNTASSVQDGCHVQTLCGLSFLMLRLSDMYSWVTTKKSNCTAS